MSHTRVMLARIRVPLIEPFRISYGAVAERAGIETAFRDLPPLCRLNEYGMLMVEQPQPIDALEGHGREKASTIEGNDA